MDEDFVRVAAVAEIAPGGMTSVSVGGAHVVICNVDGSFYAFHDQCTHECYPLSGGTLDGRVVTCLLHGARFDVGTGEVLGPPAYEPVKTYPVRVDGDDILIAV